MSHEAHAALATGSGGDADLRVAVIRMAPAPAFEQAVRRGDAAERNTARQVTARIDDAAAALAHVERLSTRVLARRRAVAGADAAHEQHARAVVGLEIVDVGLKARGVGGADARAGAGLVRDDNAGRAIAVGIAGVRAARRSPRIRHAAPYIRIVRRRFDIGERSAAAFVVADDGCRNILAMAQRIRRERNEQAERRAGRKLDDTVARERRLAKGSGGLP